MESILEEFECEVCVKYIVPPIRLCREGHSFCARCDKFLKKCPVCRSPILEICNIAVDRILNNLLIPCAPDGCDALVRGKDWKQHSTFCNADCLFKESGNCSWKGNYEDVMEHYFLSHKSNAFNSSTVNLFYRRFRNKAFVGKHNCETQVYHIVMHCYGEVFKCVLDVDTCIGIMRWVVYRVNPQSDTEYKFYVTYRKRNVQDSSSPILSYDCKVQQNNEDMEDVLTICGNCIGLLRLSGRHGIYYTVAIRKSDEPPPCKDDYELNQLAIPKASAVLN